MQNRRVFLTGAAASVALPLVGGGLVFAQAQARRVRPGGDAVLDEIGRQSLDVARRTTRPGRPITGESGRQLANVSRMLGVHLAASGLEPNLQRALRQAVDAEGRSAFLLKRPDLEHVARDLRARGLDIDVSRLASPSGDLEQRGKALDYLLANGVQQGLRKVAEAADTLGTELDKFAGGRLVQWSLFSGPNCGSLQWDLFMLEIMMIVACGPFIEVVAACAAASALYVTYQYLIWAVGC
jgi:hypothetical protein